MQGYYGYEQPVDHNQNGFELQQLSFPDMSFGSADFVPQMSVDPGYAYSDQLFRDYDEFVANAQYILSLPHNAYVEGPSAPFNVHQNRFVFCM